METTLLPDYFTNSLCRICAEKSAKLTPIVDNKSLFIKINKCLPIQVTVNDNFPVNICDNCEIKVDETYLFHETCISAEQKLKWLWNHFLKTKEGETDNPSAVLIDELQPVLVVEGEIQNTEASNVIVTLPDEVFNEEQTNRLAEDLSESNEKNVTNTKNYSDKQPARSKKYQCRFCSRQLSTLSSMSIHESTHSAEKPFLCDSCGKSFKHSNNLRSHTRTHLNIRKKFVCKVCGKSFITNFFLQEHMNSHTGETPYKCNDCGKEFREKIHLRQHKFTHSTDKFICEICGTNFNRKGNMKEHIKKHHPNKEEKKIITVNPKGEKQIQHYQCAICDNIFENETCFKIHLKSHSNNEQLSYSCVICGKKFRHSGSLTYHRRTAHTGEKPFQCSYCDQKFSLRSVQKIHERKNHTGEQPYKCAFCPKKFTNSSSLKNHGYIHMKDKIFNCNDCGKKFARKSNLLVHMKLHANDRQFTCDQCGKSYIQKHDLIKHKKIHDPKQKPFFCKFCGNNFSHKKEASKHAICQLDYARRKNADISAEKILDSVSNAFNKSSDNLFEAEQLILETVKNLSNYKT